MASYRSVYTTFWTDTKVSDDFTPEDKYFMLYCLTNNYTNLCGCYEISIKQIAIDTGYNEETIKKLVVEKAKFIYETKQELEDEMTKEDCMYLFNEIEMPLSIVLGDMEYQGIRLDKQVLDNMNVELDERIKEISEKIYELAGEKFNISSPKQLGEILFVKLQIGKGKKTKSGYSTDKTILEKYSDRHPIVPLVLEHRMLTKLQSTYIVGLASSVLDDGKIHTIYMYFLL